LQRRLAIEHGRALLPATLSLLAAMQARGIQEETAAFTASTLCRT
jgi:hypothetical protein